VVDASMKTVSCLISMNGIHSKNNSNQRPSNCIKNYQNEGLQTCIACKARERGTL
jgi:hypothetical protein